jgi:hypothetical protein
MYSPELEREILLCANSSGAYYFIYEKIKNNHECLGSN